VALYLSNDDVRRVPDIAVEPVADAPAAVRCEAARSAVSLCPRGPVKDGQASLHRGVARFARQAADGPGVERVAEP
jgi:hypothetical protein